MAYPALVVSLLLLLLPPAASEAEATCNNGLPAEAPDSQQLLQTKATYTQLLQTKVQQRKLKAELDAVPAAGEADAAGANPLTCYIGTPPFNVEQTLRDELSDFLQVFDKRPGAERNPGGTGLFHSFYLFTVIRTLKPKHVIESGAWMGLGTWLIRQACGDCQIIVVSPEEPGTYRDGQSDSVYFTGGKFQDFSNITWDTVLTAEQKQSTLVFLDDHQAHLKRLTQVRNAGFTRVVFDDNYANTFCGDSTSVKFLCHPLSATVREEFQSKVLYKDSFNTVVPDVRPADHDRLAGEMRSIVKDYVEMPPLWYPPSWVQQGACPQDEKRIGCLCKYGPGPGQLYKPAVLAWDEVDTLVTPQLKNHAVNKLEDARSYTAMSFVELKPLAN